MSNYVSFTMSSESSHMYNQQKHKLASKPSSPYVVSTVSPSPSAFQKYKVCITVRMGWMFSERGWKNINFCVNMTVRIIEFVQEPIYRIFKKTIPKMNLSSQKKLDTKFQSKSNDFRGHAEFSKVISIEIAEAIDGRP